MAQAVRGEPFSGPGWLYEVKFAGFRLAIAEEGDRVRLRYRTGRDVGFRE